MLTRRVFLKGSSLAAVSLGVAPRFLERAALAAPGPGPAQRRKVLLTIFQRGAMDGLMAVQPVADPLLASYRPRIAMSVARAAGEEAAVDLGCGFGLHPGFEALVPMWKTRELAIVHAVGSPDPTRSHFDAQDFMETGTPGRRDVPSGWLNRVSGRLGHEATPFRSVAMTPALPRALSGDQPALALTSLADFRVRTAPGAPTTRRTGQGFESLYRQTTAGLLQRTSAEMFDAIAMLSGAQLAATQPEHGASYPRSPLGEALRQIALLVKAGVGLEIAFAETGGWDTHIAQGAARGTFANRAQDLAGSVAAFWTDLGALRDDVVVMTMTEFGRTVKENGTGGTDHGHGSCLFVLGSAVDGGKVHGRFPSLEEGALYEGRDLPVTTDFRAVFSEVACRHLGIAHSDGIFPGWTGDRLPIIKT